MWLWITLLGLGFPFLATAEDVAIVKDIEADQDASISISKGRDAKPDDFKVVSSAEEISGEFEFYEKDAFSSWQRGCSAFKKDLKELNPGRVLSVSCGIPKIARAGTTTTNYVATSMATYKLLVRIRDPE